MLSPTAQQILKFVQKEEDVNRIHDSLGTLPPTNTTWDDIISGLVQLRLNKDWDQIIVVRTVHFSCSLEPSILVLLSFYWWFGLISRGINTRRCYCTEIY